MAMTAAERKAKSRGQTFNREIQKYNAGEETIIDQLDELNSLPPEQQAFWIDRVCTCCGKPGVPVWNRFLCIPCWKYAGVVQGELGEEEFDCWLYSTGEGVVDQLLNDTFEFQELCQ